MTVTVVRGFVDNLSRSNTSSSTARSVPQPSAASTSTAQAVSAVSSVAAGLSEASVATIRLSKTITAGEKLRDAREARELSEKLADKIKSDDKALDAHSDLSPVSARQHFS